MNPETLVIVGVWYFVAAAICARSEPKESDITKYDRFIAWAISPVIVLVVFLVWMYYSIRYLIRDE